MKVEKLLNLRETFFLGEKYRLDLLWDSVNYKSDKLFLNNARFTGPAMDDAEKINDNDYIDLDFYKQYYVKVQSVYIVRLCWGRVTYKESTAYLSNCYLDHKELTTVPKLNDTDYIVIDTKNHRSEDTHKFSTTYNAVTISSDGKLYNFFGNLI